jgi:glutathione synthase
MSKIKNVAVQMDHVSSIKIAGDSTFAMSMEAQARGYKLFPLHAGSAVDARRRRSRRWRKPMILRDVEGDHFELGPQETIDLAEHGCGAAADRTRRSIWPISPRRIFSSGCTPRRWWSMIRPGCAIRRRRSFVTEFPDLMPKTLISRDPATINAFRAEVGDMILKPLYGNGGAGVFHVKPDDRNMSSLLEMFAQMYREPFIAQEYLSDVRAGDKRIILIDGEPAGAINRVPAEHDSRSNMHVGGRAEHSELTDREKEICARIGPSLKARGFILVGIDIIGDKMTEINVTSPTGLREIRNFGGPDVAALFWDAVESKRAHS